MHDPIPPISPAEPPTAASLPAGAPAGLYRHIWHFAAGARRRLVLAYLALAGAALLELAYPWLAAQALNALQANRPGSLMRAALFAAAILAATLFAWALHGPGRYGERTVAMRIRQRYTEALYAKLTRLPLSWHEGRHSGEVQQRIAQAASALYGFAQSQFVYLKNGVHFIGAGVALFLFSRPLGAIALAGYVLIGYTMMRFDRALMRAAAEENAAERRFQTVLLDFLGNISTVLALRMAGGTRRALRERLAGVNGPNRRSVILGEAKWCASDLLGVALTWGLVAVAIALMRRGGGEILVGSVYMVYQYAQQARGVAQSAADNVQSLARARTDVASAAPIWNAADAPPAGPALPAAWRHIEVRGLSYAHPERDEESAVARRPAGISGVALHLARGERIALVGASGSGKSTLLRALAGHYPPQHARIAVDGTMVASVHLGSIATLIPQETEVFEGSVRANIALEGAADDAALRRALHASAFDRVMSELGLELDAAVGERGCRLSGGQRQRLCLARGLLAAEAGSLLLLDEPTSALDPLTEDAVLSRLGETYPDTCIVAAIHRLSALHRFDRVLLMEAGRIRDAGRLEELLARQSAFAEMVGRHRPRSDNGDRGDRGDSAERGAARIA